ncbi:MAG: ATP-grasp domain-containing protein [Nannocystaceae bacterium]
MPTLVLPARYSADSNALWAAAIAAGWRTARLMRLGDAATLARELAGDDVVIYGDTLTADAIAGACGLALLEPTPTWLPDLPHALRLREVRLLTLAEARRVPGPIFVKPVDDKLFPARVYNVVDVDPGVGDDLEVLVAEPVRFGVEVRAFVCEGEVVALSAYVRDGALARAADGSWPLAPAEATAARGCLERVLAEVALPPAVVVDVGEIAGRGWAVVEANPIWASGLCGAEPEAVLPALRRACVPVSRVTASDQPWIRSRRSIFDLAGA